MSVRPFFIGVISLVAGLALGEWFPDNDQRFHFLTHRSILTHGLIVPLLLYSMGSGLKATSLRLFVSGFSLGVAIHLGFDLFPRSWQGFALIHMPLIGRTHPIFSWLWIAVSMICCLYLSMRLARTGIQGAALLLGTLGLFIYTSTNETAFWGPLFSLLIGSGIALAATLRKYLKQEVR